MKPDFQPQLNGVGIRIRPLIPGDFEALFLAASDPLIWEQHSDRTRYTREGFQKFFSDALASKGSVIVEEKKTNRVIGASRFYDWSLQDQSLIIGYTFLTRDHWGGETNSELKSLMLAHAFQMAKTVFFQVSHENKRSQRALEKIGAKYSHDEEVIALGKKSTRKIFRIDRPLAATQKE